jgi:mannose-1-phosphate guanylyltransferase
MLLSAGCGSRLLPLTSIRPKPLFPVLNRPMLKIWLDKLAAFGVRRTVVNAHYMAPMIVSSLEEWRGGHPDMEVIVSVEKGALGTGGGLKKASGHFPGPFFVVNSDIYTDFPLSALEEAFLSGAGPAAALACGNYPGGTVSAGAGGRVLAFRSPDRAPGEEERLYGLGLMALDPDVLKSAPEGASDIIEVLGGLLAKGAEALAVRAPGVFWADMGTAPDYYRLCSYLARGGRFVEEGADVRSETSGFLQAGAGCVAEPGAFLENCVLWPEARVEAGCVLKSMIVAGRARAGVKMSGGVVTGGGS